MKKVYLKRKRKISNLEKDICILGKLVVDGEGIAVTLENPWLNNAQDISCIPQGEYICVRDKTGKHHGFKLLDVPSRENVEIHVGNYVKNTKGCILVGNRWAWGGENEEEPAIFNSKVTLEKIIKILPSRFLLVVS